MIKPNTKIFESRCEGWNLIKIFLKINYNRDTKTAHVSSAVKRSKNHTYLFCTPSKHL